MESEIKTGGLMGLLEKKKDSLENIKKLTAEMIEALKAGKHEEFTRLLSSRQKAMDDSNKIDDEILCETGGQENFALILQKGGELALYIYINEIRRKLNELKAIDDELKEKAKNAFDELKQKMDDHYKAKKAYIKYRNLYEGAGPSSGFFIDEKK
jgi:hypothetical protein